jgi:hypothetical protein
MRSRTILCLALVLAAGPAAAGDGFLDRLFGGSSGSAPPNPFASNYPSAPPSAEAVRDARRRQADRGSRPENGPVPPGRIPE